MSARLADKTTVMILQTCNDSADMIADIMLNNI